MIDNEIDLTEGPVLPKLLKFSIPIVFSSIFQLLFNTADLIVVGRFAGDIALAAVGATTTLINLLVNLSIGLSIGTNVVASHFNGARDYKSLSMTVHTSIVLSFFSGLILSLIGFFGSRYILILMQVPENILPLSTLYLKIYFAGLISTVVYNFASAILRAKGDTKRPLYILVLSGFINLLLNLLFVILFKMSVSGVAFATVISQTFAAFAVIILLLKEKSAFHLDLRKLSLSREFFIKILKIGLPASIQGCIFSLSNVIIQSSVNSFGDIAIAGNTSASSLEGFVFLTMSGISQGTLTFTSQNVGARKFDRIKKLFYISQILEIIAGLSLGLLFVIFSKYLLSFYTKSDEVISYGKVRLTVICSLYFFCGLMDVMSNLIRGSGHSVMPMIVTLVGVCGIRILWIFTLFQIPSLHTLSFLYVSYPVSWLVTYICHFIMFKKVYKIII